MSLGLIINVKGEVDLLKRNIDYHESIGVECFLIGDRGSSPEELEQINELVKRDNVSIFIQDITNMALDSDEFLYKREILFAKYHEIYNTDCVAVIDTDEFLLSRSKGLLAPQGLSKKHIIRLPRYNIALGHEEESIFYECLKNPDELRKKNIIVNPIKFSHEDIMGDTNMRWILKKIGLKCMTNIKSVKSISPGFHDMDAGRSVKRGVSRDLILVHFPFSSFERFAQKVENIREHFESLGGTFKPNQASHWRRWANLVDDKELRDEFNMQFFESSDLENLKKEGIIMDINGYFYDSVGQ